MTISEVRDKKDKKHFIDFPHDLYKGDPNYVPELYIAQAEVMDEKKNPFFQHSKAQLFLARRNGQVVGRIAAIRNNNYNEYINVNVGFFGFLICFGQHCKFQRNEKICVFDSRYSSQQPCQHKLQFVH